MSRSPKGRLGDLLRHRERGVGQFRIRHHAVDHADVARFLSAQLATREEHFLGLARTHHPGVDQHFGGRRAERVTDGVGEERAVARDHQVAHVGDHETARHTGALHLRDGGLGKVPDLERVVEVAQFLIGPALLHGEVRALGLGLLQVVARREMRTLAAHNHHVHGVIHTRLVEGGHQLVQQLLALCIALRLAGQQDAAHRAVVFDFERFVRHALSPKHRLSAG